jgi:hypothetical protein
MPCFAQVTAEQLAAAEIRTEKVGGNLYVLFGLGGNIAVSVGEQGVLAVDTQFPELVPRYLAAIRELGGRSVDLAINTHWHYDHADGNLVLGPTGTWIVAQANSRAMLTTDNVINTVVRPPFPQKAYPTPALPVATFTDEMQLTFNGETIDLMHFGAAHTTGTPPSSSARTGSLGDRTSAIEPFVLESGNGLYLLSFSGEINGEFQGDLRISLEGTPAMDYRLVNLAPIRFFGRNQGQGLKKHILHGLNRGDKLAILVVMQPQLVKVEGFEVPIASCCAPPRTRSSGSPDLSEPIQSPLTPPL